MNALRAYDARYKDDDCACCVVAYSARQAKQIFAQDAPNAGEGDWTDIRARWMKRIAVPESITAPILLDECPGWGCSFFEYCEFQFDCQVEGKALRCPECGHIIKADEIYPGYGPHRFDCWCGCPLLLSKAGEAFAVEVAD